MKKSGILVLPIVLFLAFTLPGETTNQSEEVDTWALANEFKEKLNVEWLNLTLDNNENILITGFYSDTLKIQHYSIPAEGALDIFIAKYSKNKDFIWVKHAGGSNIQFSRFINTDAVNNIYIQGMFKGEARFGQEKLYSETFDFFTAKFDDEGELLWVKTRKTMFESEKELKRKKITDYNYTELPK